MTEENHDIRRVKMTPGAALTVNESKSGRVYEAVIPPAASVNVHCDGLQYMQELLAEEANGAKNAVRVSCDGEHQAIVSCESGKQPQQTDRKAGTKFDCK